VIYTELLATVDEISFKNGCGIIFTTILWHLVESDEVLDSSVDNNRYSTKDYMIAYLKEQHKKLGEKTNILLREHVKFGKGLKRARKEFMKYRKKWCITDK